MLRRIHRPKRDEVAGERGKLHIEEPTDLHTSPNLLEWGNKKELDGWGV